METQQIIEYRDDVRRHIADNIRHYRNVVKEARSTRGDADDIRRWNGKIREIMAGPLDRNPKLTAAQAKREAEGLTAHAIDVLSRDISHLPCGADDAYIEGAQALKEEALTMWRVYIRLAAEEDGARGYWHL